jgi:glycosyltransferase involved in cell wall biosynthesis
MTILALFALWERVNELALGGIKYGVETINRFKKVKCVCLTTQKVGLKYEISIGEKFTLYAYTAVRRVMYYILLLILIIKGIYYIKKEDIKVIFSPGVGWVNYMAAYFLSLLSRRKLALVFHHWPYSGWDKRSVYISLRNEGRRILGAAIKLLDVEIAKKALKRADTIFTVSQSSKDELIKLGIPEEKIVVAYPGVDDEFFKENFEKTSKVFDAISVCRISPEKGIYDLIEIWKRVIKNKKIKLGVMGAPTKILDKWLAKIKENNLDAFIEYLGVMERKSMMEVLRNAKVFVFASRKEGFGIAVAEAMACGLPVVCYDIKPLNELFNSKGVFFVKPFDFDDFARKILMLIEDEELRKTAGKYNREFARKFKWDETAKIIEERLIALMGGDDV